MGLGLLIIAFFAVFTEFNGFFAFGLVEILDFGCFVTGRQLTNQKTEEFYNYQTTEE